MIVYLCVCVGVRVHAYKGKRKDISHPRVGPGPAVARSVMM